MNEIHWEELASQTNRGGSNLLSAKVDPTFFYAKQQKLDMGLPPGKLSGSEVALV